MKYLQIYDHLGNLIKEFEVYVDGQDFNWAAPKPEPVWLGTIRLVAEKAAGQVEPTPEPELELTYEREHPEEALTITVVETVKPEPESEAEKEQEVPTPAPFTTQETTTKSLEPMTEEEINKEVAREEAFIAEFERREVKHEPEKRSDKSRRAKGTRSQSRSKRT